MPKKKEEQTAEEEVIQAAAEQGETAEEEAAEPSAAEEQTPAAEIEELQKQAEENYDKYLRLAAEFDNYKKRTQKEKEELSAFVAADIIEKLLPVIDNLERALSTCEGDKDTPMYDGVKMVLKQCGDIFSAMGVAPIEAAGQPFDPNLHNAVMHVEDDSLGENIVAEELMKGYLYKDKVIRYSMVKVAN